MRSEIFEKRDNTLLIFRGRGAQCRGMACEGHLP